MTFQSFPMLKSSTGKTVDPIKLKEIAAGGEGRVLEYSSTEVLKVYHTPRPKAFENHLKSLMSLSKLFISPNDVWYDNTKVAGFTMPYVDLNSYKIFSDLFNKSFCSTHKLTLQFKVSLLTKLKAGLDELHSKGIVVGDLNQYNIFFNFKGDLLFVDVDSFQTSTQPHNGVLLDDIRDWVNPAISDKTDTWSFNILSFWSTTYCHPFRWVVKGNTESLEARVKQGKSLLTSIPNVIIPKVYEPLDNDSNFQFKEIFEKHHRYPVSIGTVVQPITMQIQVPTIAGDLNILELVSEVYGVYATETMLVTLRSDKWVVYNVQRPGLVPQVQEFSTDEYIGVYPGKTLGHFALLTKDYRLITPKLPKYSMQFHDKCIFQYVSTSMGSSLIVIDPYKDLQYIFDIESQYGNIGFSTNPIFYKSVVQREALIQNFGAKTYINSALQSNYFMLPVPQGVKNAHVVDRHVMVERKDRAKVVYEVYAEGKLKISYDSFAHFCKKGTMLFLPNDGLIEAFTDSGVSTRFNLAECTKDSRLFSTGAGIVMLEANKVYLLNTKS